jgi:hypothetical protein
MTDQEALDDAKRRYLAARADIDRLRRTIASAACPIAVGDRVTVTDGNQTYEGLVDDVGAAPSIEDYLNPTPGAATPWVASGRRIRKTDGQPSKWTFSIPSNAECKHGVWHLPERGIEAVLGLPKLP